MTSTNQDNGSTATEEPAELQALRMRNQFLEAFARLSGELINTADITALFPAICKQILDLTEADSVYIAFLSPDQQFLDLKYFAHTRERPTLKRMKITDGVGGNAIELNSFVKIEDYEAFPTKVQHVSGIKAAIGQPIRRNQKANGALTLLFTDNNKVNDVQPDLLEMFSGFVSAVVENAEIKHRMQQERDMQSAMLDIHSAMHKSDSLEGIIDSVCARIMETFNTTRVRVYQYTNGSYVGKSGLRIHNGSVEIETTADSSLLKISAVQWVVENQQAVLIEEGVKSDKESQTAFEHRTKMRFGCIYIMPLMVSGRCWGVLTVFRAQGAIKFRSFETRLLDLLVSQLSIAIVRQRLIEDIEYDATHDSLTGLYNRSSLNTRLDALIDGSAQATQATLLYIDLDGFKAVNDQFGHAIGDELIQEAAKRIEAELLGTSCAFRIGGDEFVVIIDAACDEQTEATATAICRSLENDYTVDEVIHKISASIGVASIPLHTHCPRQLLPYADIAMYSAKRKGGGHIALYEEEIGAQHKHRVTLKSALKNARERNEFDLYFQPKVSCISGRVEGVEALARWNHPEYGIVSPADWIAFAEQSGEINNIGRVLIDKACQWQCRFRDEDLALSMAVNISTRQLEEDNFVNMLVSALDRFGVSPDTIEIEITESVMAADLSAVSRKLDELSDFGFKIALDDFGTGYSSLRYLQHLNLDVLKIDRSFIRDLNFEHGAFLAQTVMSIARSLDLTTVAEGVETAEQIAAVVELGVDTIQGYFYSPPVPGEQLSNTIQRINDDVANPLRYGALRKAV